jgi:hypothetical protein
MKGILERLENDVVLGAEGYLFELERRGYLQSGPYVPEVVLDYPDAVKELHREFLRAGSEVMVSFTYYAHRDKLRTIGREAEQLIDDADPAEVWEQFSDWFHQQVSSAASANFVWAAERARWLAGQVAEHFAAGADVALPELRFDDEGITGKVDQLEQPDSEKLNAGNKVLTGMRGGYGGMLMIGMATSLMGIGMLNPFSVGAGLLFGAKTVRDEKKRMLQKRRSDAKTAMRKHIDEVTFQVGKDSRDMLRRTQRQLRDHFSALAEEVSTSLAASVNAAQSAVKTSTSERERRIRDLKAELKRIDGLSERARALVTDKRPAVAMSSGGGA